MSAFILKLLDESIVPAVLVFAVKVGSLVAIARYFNVSFSIRENSLYFNRFSDLVFANSLSNLFVIFTILLGSGVVLLRLYYFHESHIHPFLLTKLLESDLEFTVSTSFNLYHQILVWLSLGFFVICSLLIQVSFGLTSPLVFLFGLLVTIFLSAAAYLDLEREVKIEKKDKPDIFYVREEISL